MQSDATSILAYGQHRLMCLFSTALDASFEGVTIAARTAKQRGLLPSDMARTCERLDVAAHCARHSTVARMDLFIQEVAAALSGPVPPSRGNLAPLDPSEASPTAIPPAVARHAAAEAPAAEFSPRSAAAAQAAPVLSRSHRRRRQRKPLVAALRNDLDSRLCSDTPDRDLRPSPTASGLTSASAAPQRGQRRSADDFRALLASLHGRTGTASHLGGSAARGECHPVLENMRPDLGQNMWTDPGQNMRPDLGQNTRPDLGLSLCPPHGPELDTHFAAHQRACDAALASHSLKLDSHRE